MGISEKIKEKISMIFIEPLEEIDRLDDPLTTADYISDECHESMVKQVDELLKGYKMVQSVTCKGS